jgi:SOS-response transcriptional repressor LexA
MLHKRALHGRARAVLEAINDYHQQTGRGPTYREIAATVGVASHSNVAHHVAHLALRDLVTYEPGKLRTLRPTDRGREALDGVG